LAGREIIDYRLYILRSAYSAVAAAKAGSTATKYELTIDYWVWDCPRSNWIFNK